MASAHETTVREVYEAANRRDMDGILAGTHEAVEVTPVLGANVGANVYRGHEGIREWTEDLWGEWEIFEVTVGVVIERGEPERDAAPVEVHEQPEAGHHH